MSKTQRENNSGKIDSEDFQVKILEQKWSYGLHSAAMGATLQAVLQKVVSSSFHIGNTQNILTPQCEKEKK